MGSAHSARKEDPRGEGGLKEEAFIHLTSTRHTTQSLAQALGVSRATASRLLARLRGEGVEIESRKDGEEWYFEVKGEVMAESTWKSDPLVKRVGFIKKSRRKPGESVDDVVYTRG